MAARAAVLIVDPGLTLTSPEMVACPPGDDATLNEPVSVRVGGLGPTPRTDHVPTWVTLLERGWGAAAFAWCAALADHAAAIGSAKCLPFGGVYSGARAAAPRLAWELESLLVLGRAEHADLVIPWLEVMVACRDWNTARAIETGLKSISGEPFRPGDRFVSYYTKAYGKYGALAWAAGLSLGEASAPVAAVLGDPDYRTTLRAMAALRGYPTTTLAPSGD